MCFLYRASTPARVRALLSALYALNVALAYLLMLVGPHSASSKEARLSAGVASVCVCTAPAGVSSSV